MLDLRDEFTKEDREADIAVLRDMSPYLIPLLLRRQENRCADCGKELEERAFDVHHTVYNPKITLAELELRCVECHTKVTNYKKLKDRNIQGSLALVKRDRNYGKLFERPVLKLSFSCRKYRYADNP